MRKNNGITLIALIVTIIVLLILAGVTISMLLNQNGIFGKAQEAKLNTEVAQEKEEVGLAYLTAKTNKSTNEIGSAVTVEEMNAQLDQKRATAKAGSDNRIIVTYQESGRKYQIDQAGKVTESTELDWDEIKNNAAKHPDQTTSNDIGIGTDGKPVNLDLWTYRPWWEGDGYTLTVDAGTITESAYRGSYVDGQIIGTVPQYIKRENDEWKPVIGMGSTFCYTDQIKIAPKIPNTVTNMFRTFFKCINLETASEIPQTVKNLGQTFWECKNLTGSIKIDATPDEFSECFRETSTKTGTKLIVTGKSLNLNDIIETKSDASNIIKGD